MVISVGYDLTSPVVTEDTLIGILPSIGPYYVVRMNITFNALENGWFQVFQVTDRLGQTGNRQGNFGTTGDRYPALVTNNDDMVFYSQRGTQVDPTPDRYNAVTGQKYEIEMHQIDKNGVVTYEVLIDGASIKSEANTRPLTVRNAYLYLSFPIGRDAADVTIDNFYIESEGACDSEEYTGIMCDECSSGWYWTASDSTCNGENDSQLMPI